MGILASKPRMDYRRAYRCKGDSGVYLIKKKLFIGDRVETNDIWNKQFTSGVKWGAGTVMAVDWEKNEYIVEMDFNKLQYRLDRNELDLIREKVEFT